MNKIYKVIWSKVKHQYVVTSEFAHSCTKSTTSRVGKSAVVALAAFVLTAGVGGVSVQAADITSANQETLLAMQLSSNKDKNDAAVVPVVLDEQIDSTQSDGEEESTVQKSVQNDEGFYVRNGDKGTYNSLTKDGLWVGGTSNTTGFHVDNDGNIHTTGNAEVDGAFNAANGNVTIDTDGTTYVHAGRSELQVTDNQAVLRHGDNGVIVNNDGVSVAGDVTANNSVKVGLVGYDEDNNFAPIYGTEIGADGSFSTAQGSFSVDKDGNVWAADGNVTIDADGTTYVHANRSELQVTENQAVLRHADNGVIVNKDGVSVAGNFEAGNGAVKVSEDGELWAGSGNFRVTGDGTVYSLVGTSQFQVTDNLVAMQHGTDNYVMVSDDGVTISGDLKMDGELYTGDLKADSLDVADGKFKVNEKGEVSAADGSVLITTNGITAANGVVTAKQVATQDLFAGKQGNFRVKADGTVQIKDTEGNAVMTAGADGAIKIENNGGEQVLVNKDTGLTLNSSGDAGNALINLNNGKLTMLGGTNLVNVGSDGAVFTDIMTGTTTTIKGDQLTTGTVTTSHVTVNGEDGFASVVLDTDGSILAGSHGNFQVTSEGVLSVGNGKFTVDQYGVVEANNVISKDMYVGSQEAENRVVTKGQLDKVSSDLSDVSEDLADVNSDLAAYEEAGITAGNVDEGAAGAIAMGEGARVANGAGLPIDNAIAIGTNAAAGRNNAVAIGVNSNAAGENSVALGAGASTTANGGWNSVALGWGSIADESMVVSVGNTGENGQRRIVNVADGIDSTDAATVGQLTALQEGYEDAGIVAGNIAEEASGALAIGAGASIVNGANAAQNAIAIGTGAKVSINNAVAIGLDSNAAGENSMALGAGASTTAGGGWNSVALGNGSVADQNTVISIGNADTQRRITYVADGTHDTDAATVGQMNTLIFGSHSEAKTDLGLVNGADSLVGGINKNSNAIKKLDKLGDIDWNTIQETATTYSTMQAKMANFESALSKLDVDALSEVSTMNLNPDEVQGSREPGEGGSTGGSETQTGENASYSGNVSVGKDLTVNGDSTFKGTATFEKGADMNGQKITNVGDGAIEANSKDAVNGGQLYNVQQDVKANSQAINSLGHRVSDLGDEIDSVGAISAALAGLHPLDYDGTGSKFQISAAMGTYDGTQAAAIGGFYHFNRDVMMSLGGATSFEGDKKTAANIGVTFRVGEGASGKSVSDDVMARLEAMDQKIAALEQENKELKNVLGAIDTSLSKEFPDVPANHWAYEAVTKLAGNDVVAGYPDGEFHGDRTMTRYEMAEIIYKAMNRGAQVDQKLVEEFKPEMEQVAANETAQAASAETAQATEANA